MRTFVFGDVHGCYQMLITLLDAICPTHNDTLIFLGDLIDRGIDSKGVIDTIWAYEQQCHVICIMGNHEQMLLDAYCDAYYLKFWLQFGGDTTLWSFQKTDDLHGLLTMPKSYLDWLKNMQDYHETKDFIFTHAAVYPNLEMTKQSEQGLRWRNIDPNDTFHLSGKTIICGHTAQKDGVIYQKQGLIGIDTYAYGGGKLTALEIVASNNHLKVWQVSDDLDVSCDTIQL